MGTPKRDIGEDNDNTPPAVVKLKVSGKSEWNESSGAKEEERATVLMSFDSGAPLATDSISRLGEGDFYASDGHSTATEEEGPPERQSRDRTSRNSVTGISSTTKVDRIDARKSAQGEKSDKKRNRWASSSDDSDGGSKSKPVPSKQVSKRSKRVSVVSSLSQSEKEQGNGYARRSSTVSSLTLKSEDSALRRSSTLTLGASSDAMEEVRSEVVLASTESKTAQRRHNALLYGCRGVDCYERLNRIDEGTYGVVFRAKDKETGEVVALKQVKMTRDACKEGFPITALRETNILMALQHPNIINVREMVVGSSLDKIYMVMDYADHDIKAVMEHKLKASFSHAEVKCLMLQLLRAIAYMHEHWYIHRDLKTSNLLYTNDGRLCVCDFGLARKYGDPIRSYTHMVVTLWYRAPELLLGTKTYSTAVDMWSVGCIMAEFLTRKPLIPARSEIEALDLIFKLLGAPSEERWPGYSQLPNATNVKWKAQNFSKLRERFPASSFSGGLYLANSGFDLLNRLLQLDPNQRISAAEALDHPWFKETPLPKEQHLMPTFPASNDLSREKLKATEPGNDKEVHQGPRLVGPYAD